jgi:CubicO group peptidase (beta-lactamase class C family)
MKKTKKILQWVAVLLIVLNLLIVLTGHSYLYFAIQNTYLKGRVGPSPIEYEIFDNRTIEAGQGIPWPKAYDFGSKKIPDSLEKDMRELKTLAYLVLRNDSLVFENYWEGHGPDAISNSFSMAKTFVSILTGIAISEGKIKSENDKVGDYLPEFNKGKNASLTIKHLLTMSSGINFDEDYKSPIAYPAKAYYGNDLTALTMQYEVAQEPGKTFEYLSGNTEILAFVLKKATGKSISEYASEKLWKPLGAESNALWNLDHENGVEKAYCCYIASARDFARLGSLYMNHGKFRDQQIVPEEYVAKSIVPADLTDAETGKKINKYGYSWWLVNYKGEQIFYARGILGQYVIMLPSKKIIAVRLGHKRSNEKINDHPVDLFRYIDAALEIAGK